MDVKYFDPDQNIFSLQFSYLKIVGLTTERRIVHLLRMIFQNFIFFTCYVHFLTCKRSNGFAEDFLDSLALGITGFGMNYNIFFYLKNKKILLKLIDRLNTFTLFGKPESSDKINLVCRKFLRFYQGFVLFGVTFFTVLTLMKIPACLKLKQENADKQKLCGLMAQFFPSESLNDFPANQLVMTFQVISAMLSTQSMGAIYNTIIAICENLVCRIEHLKLNFKKLDVIKAAGEKEEHLKNCIEYHKDIIDLVKMTNDCFSTLMFSVITMDTVVIGILAVQLLLNTELHVAMHVTGWVCTLAVLAFSGQRLQDASLSIQDCIYEIEWYKENPRVQKDLNFIIYRSQTALILETGGLGSMCMASYLKVLKTSYSYVAVFQQSF